MTSRVLPLAGVAAFVLVLAGCAGVPTETSDSGSGSSSAVASDGASTEKSAASERTASRETSESKRSETTASSSSRSDPDAPRSSWRAERDGQRAASSGNADNAKLLEQLNDASRELATLRAANAKLRAERASPAPAASSGTVAKSDLVDEKLATAMKSYGQFRQEMTTMLADLERLRKENAGMSSNLKSAVDQAEQARASMAKLETELRNERKSRAEAERLTAQLRDQLRTIAKALSSAGINVDKLAANADAGR